MARTLLIVQSFDPVLRVAFDRHFITVFLFSCNRSAMAVPGSPSAQPSTDLGALYQPMEQGAGAGQTAQIGTLLFTQDDRGLRGGA